MGVPGAALHAEWRAFAVAHLFPTEYCLLPGWNETLTKIYKGCIKKKFTVGKSLLMQRALNV